MPFFEVASPLPGTFYRSVAPEAPPFVSEGQHVRASDVIGIVEVMKQFNEITADAEGVVVSIAVVSGDAVEAGQTLLVIETTP